jgi:hypothetical protein
MKPPGFELIQPHSLEEACSILGEHDGKAAILAGGIALVVAFRYRLSKPTVYPGDRKPRPLAMDECAKFWPGCRPAWGVSQVPRLRAETHFGVQARALPAGLHIRESAQNTEREIEQ